MNREGQEPDLVLRAERLGMSPGELVSIEEVAPVPLTPDEWRAAIISTVEGDAG